MGEEAVQRSLSPSRHCLCGKLNNVTQAIRYDELSACNVMGTVPGSNPLNVIFSYSIKYTEKEISCGKNQTIPLWILGAKRPLHLTLPIRPFFRQTDTTVIICYNM